MTQTFSAKAPGNLELAAYADGRLDAGSARGREIKAWLETHASARERVRDYRQQDDEIRRYFAPTFAAPIPPHMRPQAIRDRQHDREIRWLPAVAVAIVAALALSWSVHLDTESADLDAFAHSVAYQKSIPNEQGEGPFERALAKPALNFIPPGFEQAGERRLQSTDGLVVTEHIYRDGSGRNLRIFTGDKPRDTVSEMQWLRTENRAIVYWRNGSRMFAISGDVSEVELQDIAARALLEGRGDSILADEATPHDRNIGQSAPDNLPASQPPGSEATASLPAHEGPLNLPGGSEAAANIKQTEAN